MGKRGQANFFYSLLLLLLFVCECAHEYVLTWLSAGNGLGHWFHQGFCWGSVSVRELFHSGPGTPAQACQSCTLHTKNTPTRNTQLPWQQQLNSNDPSLKCNALKDRELLTADHDWQPSALRPYMLVNKCCNVKCTAVDSIAMQKLLYYHVNTARHLTNTKYTRIDYSRKSKTRILKLAWIKFGGTFSILYISNQQKCALARNPVRFCAFISRIHLNMSKTLAKRKKFNYEGKYISVNTVLIHGETAPPRGMRLQR